MDALKRIGYLLKTHYEKVILSVVLLVLLAAAAYLPYRVGQNRSVIREVMEASESTSPKASEPVDLEPYQKAIRLSRKAPELQLSGKHNVFNPHVWKRTRDGAIVKFA